MIKNLLVNLTTGISEDATLDYVCSLARILDAHATGVAFACEVVPVSLLVFDDARVWIEHFRKQAEEAAKAAVERFQGAARRAGIAADARWISTTSFEAAELFSRLGRCFDLTVVRQTEPDSGVAAPQIIASALFETGRPTLVIPYIQKGAVKLDRIMICWDGSRSAARAVNDAIPLLRRAKTIDIVIVAEPGKSVEMAGADIADHLARHDLTVEVRPIISPEVKPAEVILTRAADCSADLLVMGGFGHSRLREFVLGGVTRTLLESMTVPVFMSH